MPCYAWLTDPHFNFLSQKKVIEFFLTLDCENLDGVFITGDISTGTQVARHLKQLSQIFRKPIYFVLGNHDFYRSSFSLVENQMVGLTKNRSNLHYITNSEPISLSPDTALIGHDGWYDAGWRSPLTNLVFIWDWFFISEFRALFSNDDRLEFSRKRAEAAAEVVRMRLRKAFENHSTVMFLTHFPPWPEADPCSHSLLERFWHPYNSSRVMAKMLEAEMLQRPEKKLIVLAGHTHDDSYVRISDNIEIRVGGAGRGNCEIKDFIIL